MKKIFEIILKQIAQVILWRYKPLIIGITGSVGKTSTKEAVFAILKNHFKVRKSIKSYNNELGVPLTILGMEAVGKSYGKWLYNTIKSFLSMVFKLPYPQFLILEMGADKPNDIKYLTKFACPKISVVTAIGQFPVHIEFFPEKDSLINEKSQIIRCLSHGGTALLNYDDLSVRDMRDLAGENVKVLTYGFGEGADIKLSNFKHHFEEMQKPNITFKISYKGSIVPIKINKTLGRQQAYAAAAAAGVGITLGLNLIEISSGLKKYRSLPGRTNLILGIKNTHIIDDTYNSSPAAALAALEILSEFPNRKIAVLADMLELGKYSEEGHRQVGAEAAQVTDLLFVIGSKARFLADEAQKTMSAENIYLFDTTAAAGEKLQELITENDIILVKGSRSMHTEKIVKEIMACPEKADKLLVN